MLSWGPQSLVTLLLILGSVVLKTSDALGTVQALYCQILTRQIHSGQSDESGLLVVRGEMRSPDRSQEPVPQLSAAHGEHARLQSGQYQHHRQGHGSAEGDPRDAASGRGWHRQPH